MLGSSIKKIKYLVKKKNEKIIGIFQKFYILIKYLVIKLLNQFKMIIFRIKKMIKIKKKKKMITKLVYNHLCYFDKLDF